MKERPTSTLGEPHLEQINAHYFDGFCGWERRIRNDDDSKTNNTAHRSETFHGARGGLSQTGVDFAGWGTHDQITDGVTSNFDVREGTKKVNFGIRHHDSSSGGVFDGELRFPVFSGDSADRSRQIGTRQTLHIGDVEGVDVKIIDTQEGNGVFESEAHHEGSQEILSLLNGAGVGGVLGGSNLDRLALLVHADLELHVLHNRLVDVHPLVLQGRQSMGGHGYFSAFDLAGSFPQRGELGEVGLQVIQGFFLIDHLIRVLQDSVIGDNKHIVVGHG